MRTRLGRALVCLSVVPFLFLPAASQAQPYAYVAAFDGNVRVIDTATQTVAGTIPGGNGLAVAAHPSGTTVYVTASDGAAVISTATNTVTDTILLDPAPIRLVASPNGKLLYGISFSGTVWIVDTETKSVLGSFAATGSAHRGLEIHPGNQALYITNQNQDTVSVIDPQTNMEVAAVAVGDGPFNVAVHPGGGLLWVANYFGGTVSVVDTASNTELGEIPAGSSPFALAVHPDGTRLWVSVEVDNTVVLIDTATHMVVDTIQVGALPQGIAVRPDGRFVYVANAFDDNVSVIDTLNNNVVTTVATTAGPLSVGRFISPPVNVFADGFESGTTAFWSRTTP